MGKRLHVMTPARKAALRRAQKASAQKRKRNGVAKHYVKRSRHGKKILAVIGLGLSAKSAHAAFKSKSKGKKKR